MRLKHHLTEASNVSAFFISPSGGIVNVGTNHISGVINNPELFGLTMEEIQKIYDKHGETLGTEGRAREEILLSLINKGWIRIRRYPRKFWTINVQKLTKKVKDHLSKWAKLILNKGIDGFKEQDKFMPVNLDSPQGQLHMDINDLANDYLYMMESFDDDEENYNVTLLGNVNEATELTPLDYFPGEGGNLSIISEAGLSRLIQQFNKTDQDFAIITAYNIDLTKKQKIQRNRKLRGILNSKKMGVYQLIGHWVEASVDSIERSYFVPNTNMTSEEFESFIFSLVKEFTQEAAIIRLGGQIYLLWNNGTKELLGNKITLNKIAQAYSQMVGKPEMPFVFEGTEEPKTNYGKAIRKSLGILWTGVIK